jgi:hypothetical protein
MSAVLKMAKSR